jgi:ABC-2 type transport system permease protein
VSADTVVADALPRILSKRERPAPAGWASAVVTHGWRALLKIKHVPFQLFDVTIMPIMFTLLFTSMFSGAMENFLGSDYIQYLLPGILVQTIVFITVYSGVGLNSDIHKGLYDRFKSLPMWQPSPVIGALLGDVFRYTTAAVVILIVGFLLGFRPGAGVLGVVAAIALVLLFAFSLSWIWIIIGMKVQTPESVMTTSFVFLMPLTFASDIFVPLDTLKWEWLRTAVAQNPVTHLATASRTLIHGGDAWGDVLWVLGASAVITAVFAPIAMAMYKKER